MIFEPIGENNAGMLRDESRAEGIAEGVAFPSSAGALAQAVRRAAESGRQITVQGGATGVSGGSVPRGGLLVSTRRMDRILSAREENGRFFLRAEAGATLARIKEYLTRPTPLEAAGEIPPGGKYFFPPNPSEKTAALGGAYACDAAGMNCIRYGAFSASVNGVSWATPEGELWNIKRGEAVFGENGCPLPSGGVIPLPSGLAETVLPAQTPRRGTDLIDFLAGSEGRLGIAAELELALEPVPQYIWGVMFFFAPQGDINAFAEALPGAVKERGGTCGLDGCEYIDAPSLGLLRANRDAVQALSRLPLPPGGADGALYIELSSGDEAGLEDCLGEILELFTESGGREDDTWAADSPRELEKFRAFHHAVPELANTELDKARSLVPGLIKQSLDVKLPPGRLAPMLEGFRREAGEAGIPAYSFGHMLCGHTHVNLVPQTAGQAEKAALLLDGWRGRAAGEGGLLAWENGVGKNKKSGVWALLSKERREYYAGLQRLFDPGGVMQNRF